MPNSKKVVEFAQAIKELETSTKHLESARTQETVANAESSMSQKRTTAATRIFYTKVMPHFAKSFWGKTAVTEQDGPAVETGLQGGEDAWHANVPLGQHEKKRIVEIFTEIKAMILDQIIADSATDQTIHDWVEANKAALIDATHPDHARVMQESRTAPVTLSNGTL